MKVYFLIIVIFFISLYSFSDSLEIHCDRPVLIYNNHVGNEWVFDLQIDGKSYSMDERIEIEAFDTITIIFSVTEIDKISDHGSTSFILKGNELDFNKKYYSDIEVLVFENRGRYTGSSAKWKLRIYYTKTAEKE